MTPSETGKATYRDDWHVSLPYGSTMVYEGEGPIDPGSGKFHLLTIWAHESLDEFTLYVSDDGRGWADDLSKIFEIAGVEREKLKAALKAKADDDLVELFAERIRDKQIKVPGPRDHWMDVVNFPSQWLERNGISYSWAQTISEA